MKSLLLSLLTCFSMSLNAQTQFCDSIKIVHNTGDSVGIYIDNIWGSTINYISIPQGYYIESYNGVVVPNSGFVNIPTSENWVSRTVSQNLIKRLVTDTIIGLDSVLPGLNMHFSDSIVIKNSTNDSKIIKFREDKERPTKHVVLICDSTVNPPICDYDTLFISCCLPGNGAYQVEVIERVTSSINEFKEIILSIFPNPSSGIVNLHFNVLQGVRLEDYTIDVLDLTGRTLLHKNISELQTQIDMGSLNSGSYVIVIKQNGSFVNSKKITLLK